jgi:hypothetical protein
MGNYFQKTGKSTSKSFTVESEAVDYARELSEKESCRQFVINTGTQYFVSTTDNVQPYEKLIAAFKSGVRVLIKD